MTRSAQGAGALATLGTLGVSAEIARSKSYIRKVLDGPYAFPDLNNVPNPLPERFEGVGVNFYNLWRFVTSDIEEIVREQRDPKNLLTALEGKPLKLALDNIKKLSAKRIRLFITDNETVPANIEEKYGSQLDEKGQRILLGFEPSIGVYDFSVLDKIDCLLNIIDKISTIDPGYNFGLEIDLADAFTLIHAPYWSTSLVKRGLSFLFNIPAKEATNPYLAVSEAEDHPSKVIDFFSKEQILTQFKERLTAIASYKGKYTQKSFADNERIIGVSPMNEPDPFVVAPSLNGETIVPWFREVAQHVARLFPKKPLIFGFGIASHTLKGLSLLGNIEQITLIPDHLYVPLVDPFLFERMKERYNDLHQAARAKGKIIYPQEVNYDFLTDIPELITGELTADDRMTLYFKQFLQIPTNGFSVWRTTIGDPDLNHDPFGVNPITMHQTTAVLNAFSRHVDKAKL